ncbi:hypothetical protein DFH06DRAFT_1239340 [Mycena polygramma]|nr:hypothetical protein DFH06DRAFT_1239340 [Mycena polygramma]
MAHGDGGGDDDGGGGGPDVMDEWESPLHRTRVRLALKPDTLHTYEVAVGYTFKFIINRETELPVDLNDMSRPLSRPEVISLVDLKIETRPRETQVDRSYASVGLIAHRAKSIIEREFLPRGFDPPDKLYKRGQNRQIQRGAKAALGFAQSGPLATASFSYNRNSDDTLEATDSKIMPKCRVDYETGNERNDGNTSYSSYNIAYEPQCNQLDAERSKVPPLEVRVGMGINLHPAGSEKPLPQISFVNRNQVLIWVVDPSLKASIRGILVLMSSYLDNIRAEEKLGINEETTIHLGVGPSTPPEVRNAQEEQDQPGTISLAVAQVEKEATTASRKFGATMPALFAKLGQRASPVPVSYIPPHEYLARGWDINNNEWRSVLWPALDKQFRSAAIEGTRPVLSIQCPWKQAHQTTGKNVQTHRRERKKF